MRQNATDSNSATYCIGTAIIKASNKNLKAYTSQLRDYASKLNSHIGVLCIFTTQDY